MITLSTLAIVAVVCFVAGAIIGALVGYKAVIRGIEVLAEKRLSESERERFGYLVLKILDRKGI